MRLTIYFNEKPVYLCDELDEDLEEKRHHPEVVYVDELSAHAVNALIAEVKKPGVQSGIMHHKNFEKMKKAFFRNFTFIEAAGGVVQNSKKEILFIFRRGKWDLPKGKLDAGEDAETCARREIEEETGVNGLVLKNKIGSTYHAYEEFGKHLLKESHWFFYTTEYSGKLVPQTDEDITQVTWVATRNIRKPMTNSYATIRNIMHTFFDTP